MLPENIRVSVGTAAVLGLIHMKVDVNPTTAYLMLYTEKKCVGNCGFCPQGRESNARNDALARIFWPKFTLVELKSAFEDAKLDKKFERICIQVINYVGFFEDLKGIVKILKDLMIPISVSVQPLSEAQMKLLHELGVKRIGIPFDAATKSIFYQVKGEGIKGPYKWETHLENLKIAQSIFGPKNVSTHLIIGLGETESEAVQFIQKAIDSQVLPALFTFTPIKGTLFEKNPRPTIFQYRKMQLVRFIMINNICRSESFSFNQKGELIDFGISTEQLFEIIQTGKPFLTSGCSGCNRPYYNERPGEILYNYPRPLNNEEIVQVLNLFKENM